MQKGADYHAQDHYGRTALHHACRAGNLENVSLMFQIEDINVNVVTRAGVTPLMMAAKSGNVEVVAACLNANMNPFPKDGLGNDVKYYASQF